MVQYVIERDSTTVTYGLDHATGIFLIVERPGRLPNNAPLTKEFNEVIGRIKAGETGGEADEFNLYTGPCGIGIKVSVATMVQFLRQYGVPQNHINELTSGTNPSAHEAEYRRVLPMMQEVSPEMGDTDAMRQTGNEHFQAGRFGTSVEWYTKAYLAGGSHVKKSVALANRALAYLNLHNHGSALNDASTALSFDSSNHKARYRKALALFNMRRFNESIAVIKELLRGDPGESALYNELLQRAKEEMKH